MDRAYAEAFAANWAESWNEGDLDAIVGHFHADAVFRSPKAAQITGNGVIEGREALRAYWAEATALATSRRFTVLRTVWNAEDRELVVVYISEIDGTARRACEFFRFDAEGHVMEGEAMHGIALAVESPGQGRSTSR